MTPILPERPAVRAILFNPAGHVLLIKYRGNADIWQRGKAPVTEDHWGTAGGGIDAGEDAPTALRREMMEEIGHTDIVIGPEVWHRRAHMVVRGHEFCLDERYFIVHTPHMDVADAARTESEKAYVLDAKWWQPADIATTQEIILPPFMKAHIEALAAGNYPQQPLLFDETKT